GKSSCQSNTWMIGYNQMVRSYRGGGGLLSQDDDTGLENARLYCSHGSEGIGKGDSVMAWSKTGLSWSTASYCPEFTVGCSARARYESGGFDDVFMAYVVFKCCYFK
ncbi:unnamed protein product, partial [Meganyctiphanes norvegica]